MIMVSQANLGISRSSKCTIKVYYIQKSKCQYHIVFVLKYKKKVLYMQLRKDVSEMFFAQYGYSIEMLR